MKIAVLTSGGVDSSVALRLLKDQGHEITAFYLKIWLEDELSHLTNCPWEEDLSYVQEICSQIDVPLQVVPMQKQYHDKVVSYTINEVKAGRTPNPDVMCNSMIKFGLFLDKYAHQFDKIASGHYAQIHQEGTDYFLKQAPDPIKDQTYFLSRLSQKQLSKLIFPIGHLPKSKVRELAQKYNLPNKARKDSQGICFLGKFKYKDFIKNYLGETPGDLIEFETGETLGQHKGFYYHTIGQRKGIELSGGPWFVVKKDISKNIVYISKNYHSQDKKRDTVKLTNFNWFSAPPQNSPTLKVKLRHGEQFHKPTIISSTEQEIIIKLDTSDQGIAPGQFAVFYSQDLCLGSAMIT